MNKLTEFLTSGKDGYYDMYDRWVEGPSEEVDLVAVEEKRKKENGYYDIQDRWVPTESATVFHPIKTGYHVAPIEARKSIGRYGIDPSKSLYDRWSTGKGFYFFDNLEQARWYAEYMGRTDPPCSMDVWEVKLTDGAISDSGLSSDEEGNKGSWYYPVPVPASAVKLVWTFEI
jgi:hypothetical protein